MSIDSVSTKKMTTSDRKKNKKKKKNLKAEMNLQDEVCLSRHNLYSLAMFSSDATFDIHSALVSRSLALV